ncbi:30S ribosomal protein S1 [Candidatus Falkowbacteria bacterium]|nr:MAG: 30S ribosomal protein S1 [Candidatus Falkowbacteria bacterium]
MADTKNEDTKKINSEDFQKLVEEYSFRAPLTGETIRGKVISASKAEVKLDIHGILTGVVRGPELYEEDEEYSDLKPGDEVEATVIEEENENGELELSFKFAGQEKAWSGLRESLEKKSNIKIKIIDANKGGLLVKYRQIPGFLPVSQLAPENYPRVSGGDKGKILDKLRSFVGQEFTAKVVTIEEKEDKIIFSEKDAWNEKQKDVISKYKVGTVVEGTITAVTDFGVFISFGENLEGLVHISELAWQRIENPNNLFKVGDKIKAEVISLDNSKIFLSAKKLMEDPWENVGKKYKVSQIVKGKILKVNPFGLFVSLDNEIHGLAHISQLGLAPKQRVNEKFKAGEIQNFEIVSIEPKDHRLGLACSDKILKEKPDKDVKEKEGGEEPKSKKTKKPESKKTEKKENKKTRKQENNEEKEKKTSKKISGEKKEGKKPEKKKTEKDVK